MISAISGLPDLLIDKQNDVRIDIDSRNRPQMDDVKLKQVAERNAEQTNKTEPKQKKFSQEAVDALNKELSSMMENTNLSVEFKFQKEDNQFVMKLIDDETKEVVRQVPPEIKLKISRIVAEQLGAGAIADAKV